MTPRNEKSRPRLSRKILLAAGGVCVFAAVVVFGQMSINANDAPQAGPSAPPSAEDSTSPSAQPTAGPDSGRPGDSPLARRDPDDPMAIGDVDAPVVLIEWTDLRCPFCASFTRNSLPTIIEEYVDAGLVRIEVNDVAYFGEQSEDAAVAARAAAEQDMFFEYLDAVYAEAPENSHPDMPRDSLIAFAEKAGIPDMAQFTADLDDPDVRAAAQKSTAFAQQIGVNAVPFFVAGDVALSGAQPTAIFREYLDQAVEEAR